MNHYSINNPMDAIIGSFADESSVTVKYGGVEYSIGAINCVVSTIAAKGESEIEKYNLDGPALYHKLLSETDLPVITLKFLLHYHKKMIDVVHATIPELHPRILFDPAAFHRIVNQLAPRPGFAEWDGGELPDIGPPTHDGEAAIFERIKKIAAYIQLLEEYYARGMNYLSELKHAVYSYKP